MKTRYEYFEIPKKIFDDFLIFLEEKNGEPLDLKVGDVVVAVDGTSLELRLNYLQKLFSTSSKFEKGGRLYPFILAGAKDSFAKLTIRRSVPVESSSAIKGKHRDGKTRNLEKSSIKINPCSIEVGR